MRAKSVLLVVVGVSNALTGCRPADDAPASVTSGEDDAVATAQAHEGDVPTPSPAVGGPIEVELLEQDLAYGEGAGTNLVGYLAMPADAVEPLPGLIVIHESWGLDDKVKAMTRKLAAQGYVALAVDLYGGSVAGTAEQAQALMSGVMSEPDAALGNLRQAYEYLEKYAFAPTVGAIGWRFGGSWALRVAVDLPEQLDAAVVYYGQIIADEDQLATLDMPVLGLFAELDDSIPVRDVQRFRSRLLELGKPADIRIYPGAGHAFADPGGNTYAADAADDAWNRTVEFLRINL